MEPAERPPETLQAIRKSHPVPKLSKLESHLWRLEKTRAWYKERAETAPDEQQNMFRSNDSALSYAITMIKLYYYLTQRLASLDLDDK